MLELIKELCAIPGVSGREDAVREYIIGKIEGHAEYHVDALGNLIVFKKGKKPANHKVMLDAHMDEVGFIITGITPRDSCASPRSAALTPAWLSAERSRWASTV